MNDRRVLVVVAVVAAALVIVSFAWLFRSSPPPPAAGSVAEPANAVAAASQPTDATEAPSIESASVAPTATPAPSREYRVFGRVLMPDGAPADGATVSLDWFGSFGELKPGEPRLAVETGADGAFELRAPTNYVLLRAAKTGFSSVSLTVHVPEGDASEQALTLGTEARLAGRVVRREGSADSPLAGVTVEALRHEATDRDGNPRYNQASYVVTTTDEAGQFAFGGLQLGEHLVRARLADGGAIYQTLHATTENALFVFEPGTFAEVSGIVVDASGAPVEGARVEWRPDTWMDQLRPQAFIRVARDRSSPPTSAVDGGFSVPGIDRGLAISLTASTNYRATRTGATVTAGIDSTDVRLVLQGGWTINGRVVDATTQAPLADVAIADYSDATIYPGGRIPDDLLSKAVSAADGSFRLEIATGSMRPSARVGRLKLRVEKAGWRTVAETEPRFRAGMPGPNEYYLDLPTDSSNVEVTIPMTAAATLAGRVVRADGKPVTKGHIALWGKREARIASGRVPPPQSIGQGPLGADGAFSFSVPLNQTFEVNVSVDDYGHHSDRATMGSASRDDCVITLPRLGGVEGVVVDRAGEPLSGVLVYDQSDKEKGVTTGGDGRFALSDLYPGSADLWAERDGYTRVRHQVREVPAGTVVDGQRIVLDRAGHFGGRVLDAQRKPVAKARLELDYTNQDLRASGTETDDQGRFDIPAVPLADEVTLAIKFGTEEYTFRNEQVKLDSTANELVLERRALCTLLVSVVDSTTQDPVSGLEIVSKDEHLEAVVEDRDLGLLRIDNLSVASEFHLTLSTPNHPQTRMDESWFDLPPSVDDGAVLRRVVRLDPMRSLKGRVVRATDRQPLAGVAIKVDDQQRRHGTSKTQPPAMEATTDADGRFAFDRVPFRFAVVTFTPAPPLVELSVKVPHSRLGGIDMGDIALEGGRTLRVQLVDAQGRPKAGSEATLWLSKLDSYAQEARPATTNSLGIVEFPGLPPSTWRLEFPAENLTINTYNGAVVVPDKTLVVTAGDCDVKVAVRRGGVPVDFDYGLGIYRQEIAPGLLLSASPELGPPDPETGLRVVPRLSPGRWTFQLRGNRQRLPFGGQLDRDIAVGIENLVVFEFDGGTLRGRVVDEAGQPVRKPRMTYTNGMSTTKTSADAEGAFHFGDLEAGTYTLWAEAGDLLGELKDIELAKNQVIDDLTIVASSRGRGGLIVTAKHAETNAPLRLTKVRLLDSNHDETEQRGELQSDGSWVFDDIPTGTWNVSAEVADLGSGHGKATIVAGQVARVETRHEPVGAMDWAIVDENGLPLNIHTTIQSIERRGSVGQMSQNGRVQLTNMRVGRYRAIAGPETNMKPGPGAVLTEFEIKPNQTTTLRTVVPRNPPSPAGTPAS